MQLLVERCLEVLPNPDDMRSPKGYRDSLALCIVDAVQSPGVKYATVESVIGRYRSFRAAEGGDADTDGSPELLSTFQNLGVEGWIERIGTRNRTPPRPGAPYKAEAIRQEAAAFRDAGIFGTADLRAAVAEGKDAQVFANWADVVGQQTGITWHYLLMLAGVPGVKPDRMIARFVTTALGYSKNRNQVPREKMISLVTAAAAELGTTPTTLDHEIWRWQRRQAHATASTSRRR
ncbi:hypothetical protein [Jatrophihabitans fulvus]